MKPVRRLREPLPSWRFHALKDQRRRLEGFTKPPRRVRVGISWGSYTMMLVIVLGQYYTVLLTLTYLGLGLGLGLGLVRVRVRVSVRAGSKGPCRNFVGFLHDDACYRVGLILYCFVDPQLLRVRVRVRVRVS